MRKALAVACPWKLFAPVLFAVVLFTPASNLLAQAAASAQTQEFTQNVKEVYFPFNIYDKTVNPEVLDSDAVWLKQHPDTHFWIQGYADARGDIFYNLVLSYRRAQFIKSTLIRDGVSDSQIGYATGWGKLYPTCSQDDAACYQKNRRADIVPPDVM